MRRSIRVRSAPPAAALIIAALDRCRVAAGVERIAEGERMLVQKAQGLALDDVRKLVVRVEAWLDPDGVEPQEEERRNKRALSLFERDGMVHLNAVLDVETAAPVVTAIRGFVTAAFAARKDTPDAGAPDADRRTVPMIQADALAVFCAHVLGCERRVPVAGPQWSFGCVSKILRLAPGQRLWMVSISRSVSEPRGGWPPGVA
ncbi:DUF222 domain-containing protein [Microbacterium sp. NPDC090281]|uniref:DUF222 domain-containing protein n=1 Tax=Microbacterium sp. NPDC090281 TaxID=3364208 RepID=UPI00382F831F